MKAAGMPVVTDLDEEEPDEVSANTNDWAEQEQYGAPVEHTPEADSASQEVHGSPTYVNEAHSTRKRETGTDAHLSPENAADRRTAPLRACGASSPYIAGGNSCVLDAGHGGTHESIYAGRASDWTSVNLAG